MLLKSSEMTFEHGDSLTYRRFCRMKIQGTQLTIPGTTTIFEEQILVLACFIVEFFPSDTDTTGVSFCLRDWCRRLQQQSDGSSGGTVLHIQYTG